MCRPVSITLTLVMMLAPAKLAARADDVGTFLERHDLKQLLAVHLEEQLDDAQDDARIELILRLAALYAELLETTSDPDRRVYLEQRSRTLLSEAPSAGGQRHRLELELIRGTYRSAERIAEQHRLRLADDADLAAALRTFSEVIPKLRRIREQLEKVIEDTDRRLHRASGTASVRLSEDLERARGQAAQALFLHAWALYYQGWLDDRIESTRLAETLFAEFLDPQQPRPQPIDVSIDLRSSEAMARAILGMALCKSVTASPATAVAWIVLLEHPRAHEALRDQALGWQMAILLAAGDYRAARDMLNDSLEGAEPIPIAWLRLAAVEALEAGQSDVYAREIIRTAVTELAARNELQQVLDLAQRYGTGSLGSSGFALHYVQGVLTYTEARSIHTEDEPALDPEAVGLYERAQEQLEKALEESDVARFPSAGAACRRLVGWCRFFRGRFLAARTAFLEAADALSIDEAPNALWMAIVCLDRVVQAGGDATLAAELNQLIERFLEQYPASDHAPKLVLKRAIASEEATREEVDRLLAIPANSEVYAAARSRASQMLFQLFRDATPNQRRTLGNEYLSIAMPLLNDDAARLSGADSLVRTRFVGRCRRILEVALADDIRRLVAAREALDALDQPARSGLVDITEFADEILYRRLQERLYEESLDEAAIFADQLWEMDQEASWTRNANRTLFRYGHLLWKAADEEADDNRQAVALVVRYGGRMLREFHIDPADMPTNVLSYHAIVAEAAMLIWERSRDEEQGRFALELYRDRLLLARPSNAAFLRSAAILGDHFGDDALALRCWRRLVSGLPTSERAWFEAKFHLIDVLSRSDRQRAREVMAQHRQLNPDYGPDPWGARLKGLDLRLSEPDDDEGEDGG